MFYGILPADIEYERHRGFNSGNVREVLLGPDAKIDAARLCHSRQHRHDILDCFFVGNEVLVGIVSARLGKLGEDPPELGIRELNGQSRCLWSGDTSENRGQQSEYQDSTQKTHEKPPSASSMRNLRAVQQVESGRPRHARHGYGTDSAGPLLLLVDGNDLNIAPLRVFTRLCNRSSLA